jgi:NitT/TauT family transport system ATP-binding protein
MIKINDLKKVWVSQVKNNVVFKGLSLSIKRGEFVGFVGQNGVGKTTLFNIIAGLDSDYTGSVVVNGGNETRIGYVFQNYRQSLFPWLTAGQNIAYPLKIMGKSLAEQQDAVKKLSQEYNVQFSLNKYPYELSGGQQQIVGVLRALISRPEILLLDEPFSAIDFESTKFLMSVVQKFWLEKNHTILLISHDIDEAILLCNRLVVFVGNPVSIKHELIYKENYPRNISLMGSKNFINTKREILENFL